LEVVVTAEITVFCQHKSHADRRAIIRTLRQVPGGWDEAPDTSTRVKMASGRSTERSIPAPSFQIMDPGKATGYLRWSFECPINRKHNVQVRQKKLNKALDVFAEAGESQVSLRLLAASLQLLD
jgi:hypothetical protein